MRRRHRHKGAKKGFTLIEVMTTVALVAMAYALVAGTTISLARYSKKARLYAQRRSELMQVCEQLRWQLRSLVITADSVGLDGRRGTEEGEDQLRFMTNRGEKHRGVVEVGYKIDALNEPDKPATRALYYREFRLRGSDGLHSMDDFDEAKWTVLSPQIRSLELEYSLSGVVWQKEWDAAIAPNVVRAKMVTDGGEEITFEVVPGLGAQRW